MPKKSARTSRQQTQNTCNSSWERIPSVLQPFILKFLSPIEALPIISTSKSNIQKHGSYIIQRLRQEHLTYTMSMTGGYHTLTMRQDGTIFAWGYNRNGQLGLGHTNNQNTPPPSPPAPPPKASEEEEVISEVI